MMKFSIHPRKQKRATLDTERRDWLNTSIGQYRFGLPQYTSYGSYTILYIDNNGGDTFCALCATWERFKTQITSGLFWEGDPQQCCICAVEIESSYGPVEEDQE